MRRTLWVLIGLSLFLMGCVPKAAEEEIGTAESLPVITIGEDMSIIELATSFMEMFTTGRYEQMISDFNATENMRKAITAEIYAHAFDGMINQNGEFISYSVTEVISTSDFDVIPIVVTCEKDSLIVNVVFDSDKLLAGFNFALYTPPKEVPSSLIESDIEVVTGSYRMPGKLVLPEGEASVPLVIFVSGSGPNDMDSTIGPNKPLRDIAYGLAEEGIGSIRFTKRTAIYGKVIGECATIDVEYIQDVVSAYDLARSIERVDRQRIFLLGHSLGGNLIPMISQRLPATVGYIIAAGSVTPVEELMLLQYRHLLGKDGEISTDEKQILEKIENGVNAIGALTSESEYTSAELLGVPAVYWLSLKGYEPLEVAKGIEERLLILQGEKDYQVPMSEFSQWKEALPKAQFITYPELNHLFMKSNDTFDSNEYIDAQEVDIQVIEDIAGFINH